ncbi:MAG: hypothetical protein QE271_06255 [Bacteriovoracaceae bacterium]|nr:hypothetical protein [Bacteriovoracaceae bacterium]
MSVICYNCSHNLDYIDPLTPLSRQETCPKCYRDLRVCRMCQFYDTSSYNDCGEPAAERVVDKTKSNFCNFFRLNLQKISNSGEIISKSNSKEDLLAKARDLFKK